MRTVCFTDHLELEFQGNIFSKALIAADVDNDNCTELVAGNIQGDLFIYKGTEAKPWLKATDLGTIACITVGDACNHGLNYVVCLTSEGLCHIFSVRPDAAQTGPLLQSSSSAGQLGCEGTSERITEASLRSESTKLLKAAYSQKLRCNARVALIADVDGDGRNELVISYTDRLVQAYKWLPDSEEFPCPGCLYRESSHQSAGQAGTSDRTQAGPDRTQAGPDRTQVGPDRTQAGPDRTQTAPDLGSVDTCADSVESGGSDVECSSKLTSLSLTESNTESMKTIKDSPPSGYSRNDSSSMIKPDTSSSSSSSAGAVGQSGTAVSSATVPRVPSHSSSCQISGVFDSDTPNWNGRLELFETWQLAGQVGSMTVSRQDDGRQSIVVSQPGGTFVNLFCSNSSYKEKQSDGSYKIIPVTEPSVIFHPLGSARARNPSVTTEVIDSISRRKKGEEASVPNYSAICTLDGTLTLVDDDEILWSFCVDHQLFALNKLDVTGDGTEEVVVCSWDGHTYIVNLDKDVVRFKFREHVAAFYAGIYSLDKDQNVPCLFYVTFNDKIFIYYDIKIKTVGYTNLIDVLSQNESLTELMKTTGCDVEKRDEIRQLCDFLLYGNHPQQRILQ